MHLPKKILVPIDFTETSERALDYAIDLAALTGGSVTVLHAYEIPLVGLPEGALIATADMAGRLLEASRAGLEKAVESRRGKKVDLKSVLVQDPPREAILRVADEIDADLIVIGTHGRRGLARALLGSVAENVIRTATRPVLTIHGPRET